MRVIGGGIYIPLLYYSLFIALHNSLWEIYLVGQSSEPLARPMCYVSCVQTDVGNDAYVKQRLNSGGVLGGL